jgi:hypothetical protein
MTPGSRSISRRRRSYRFIPLDLLVITGAGIYCAGSLRTIIDRALIPAHAAVMRVCGTIRA